MTKDEALKMAIEQLGWVEGFKEALEQLQAENAKLEARIKLALSLLDVNDYTDTHLMGNCITLAKKACKEALEQPK